MDKHTKKQRSFNMQRIKSLGTSFEKIVFTKISKRGVRFQKNYQKVPGKPDIALPQKKRAVFLHSDFWHGWQYPRWRKILPSRFWKEKILRNRARDKKVVRYLKKKGWKVLVVWEHSLKDKHDFYINKIVNFLK